ncbi:unnamed protein product [Durusdinium trenchii]|uniref:DNA (cytosine-5-)-methyltransferase n=1 Tax=Durusdinium trenchii TaxID=1381693 RepID=A0ABP0PX70_9DINO
MCGLCPLALSCFAAMPLNVDVGLSDSDAESETVAPHVPSPGRKVPVVKFAMKQKYCWFRKGAKVKPFKFPKHGVTVGGKPLRVQPALVSLKRVAPLSMEVVSRQDPGKKDNGAKKFCGKRMFKSFGTIRCFSASTTVTLSGASCRSITDLANQVWHLKSYCDSLKAVNKSRAKMKFLSVPAAEYFSGLPLGWTSPHPGVDASKLNAFFPTVEGIQKLNAISLFSGVGGLEAGTRQWFRTVEMVEADSFCRSVLRARMADKSLDECPIKDDVVGYAPEGVAARAEAILAGFPCQGVSCAGSQKGMGDVRTRLLREVFRVWDLLPKGRVLLLENVLALFSSKPECRQLLEWLLKATEKRGLRLHWCALHLRNCGLPAGRGRVFLAATRSGDSFLKVKGAAQHINHFVDQRWNTMNTVAEPNWLCESRSETDKSRIHAMGNLVVPAQAFTAMCVLAELSKASD